MENGYEKVEQCFLKIGAGSIRTNKQITQGIFIQH